MLVLVLVAVIIIAAIGIGAVILLGTPGPNSSPPPPPTGVTLKQVTVTAEGGVTSLDPSSSTTYNAVAVDSKGVDETANATFIWSASPAAHLVISHPGAASSATVTAILAGTITITASATWNGTTKLGTANLTVNVLTFAVTSNNAHPTLGLPFLVTVRAARSDNSTDTTFNGLIHFTSTDPTAALPKDTLLQPVDAGILTFPNVIVNASGTTTITASNATYAITGFVSVVGNHPPVASFTVTGSSANPANVTLDASGSSDPDVGQTLTYQWAFGDGSSRQSASPVTTYTYANPGPVTITLTVQDNYGATGTASHLYVVHTLPSAAFGVLAEVTNLTVTGIMTTFDASASTGGDGALTGYSWQFGDGSTAAVTVPVVFHNYSMSLNGQSVLVNLTVTNNYSLSGTMSQSVAISSAALPPVAEFTLSIDNYTRTVSVNGSASHPQTGAPILFYDWSWGDASLNTNTSSPVATHVYASDSTFTITLTVVDALSKTGATSHPAVVALIGVAPVAMFTLTRNLLTVDVNASGTFDLNNNTAWLTWTWGDSSPSETFPSSQITASHTYAAAGLYTITLVANDTTNLHSTPATRYVSVGTSTLDYTFSDFFNVPYGEWWDLRLAKYGDEPVRANCFNQSSINDGVCSITNPSVPAVESYPYTNWYPQPAGTGSNSWSHIGNDPLLYAPYRFDVVGLNQGGYNVSEPVFLPVLNYAAAPGASSYVNFNWSMQYLDMATATYVTGTLGCPLGSGPHFGDDGFMIRSQIDVTLDEQEAARLFGAPTTSSTAYQNFWSSNSVPCNAPRGFPSTLESNVQNWFSTMGNTKYDVFSSFQYFYSPFYTAISATVDPGTLTTHVHIDTSAWGTDVLMARFFYWGNASYQANYLNSAAARGWWGMELAWFEDFHFSGGLTSSGMDFHLDTVMQYHFNQLSAPGPDGHLRTSAYPTDGDDVPYWVWGPWLTDYIPASKAHVSELTRYTSPYSTITGYVHSTPGTGSWIYGVNASFEFIPTSWAPKVGEQWHFELPSGNVVFYNPDTSLQPSNPVSTDYRVDLTPVSYWTTFPRSSGWGGDVQVWNQTAWTWDAFGSTSPPSWPCGCAANTYPAVPYGAIIFSPQGWTGGLGSAPLAPPAAPVSAAPTPSRFSASSLSPAVAPTGSWTSTALAVPEIIDPSREA